MINKIDKILEDIKTLTLLEASELITRMEETFKIDVSSPLPQNTSATNETSLEAVIEEKTEFSLILEEVPKDKKIAILKIVRSITGLGLKDVKELVESVPKKILENATKANAEDIKKQIESLGGKVSLT